MKILREMKEKELRLKDQIKLVHGVISEYRKKLLATEEIKWDLEGNLNLLQRDIISRFKGLSPDEVLSVRSGLTVKEIRLGKKLIAEAGTPVFTGTAGKEFVKTLKAEAKQRAEKD